MLSTAAIDLCGLLAGATPLSRNQKADRHYLYTVFGRPTPRTARILEIFLFYGSTILIIVLLYAPFNGITCVKKKRNDNETQYIKGAVQ